MRNDFETNDGLYICFYKKLTSFVIRMKRPENGTAQGINFRTF